MIPSTPFEEPERIGIDQLICYVQSGYLRHEAVMRNLELLANEVMPRLEG